MLLSFSPFSVGYPGNNHIAMLISHSILASSPNKPIAILFPMADLGRDENESVSVEVRAYPNEYLGRSLSSIGLGSAFTYDAFKFFEFVEPSSSPPCVTRTTCQHYCQLLGYHPADVFYE